MTRPAAIVMADAPVPGECKRGLEPLLGRDGCVRLQEALVSRAATWAASVGDPFVCFAPAGSEASIEALAPAGARLLPQVEGTLGERMAAAVASVLDTHPGPVLLAGVDTPQLGPAHAASALDDLDDGVDVTLGPASDGGYYLVGLRERRDAIFDLPADTWGGPQVMFLTMEAAVKSGLTIGMLRAERALEEEGDARAILADPLAPPDILAVLRPATR